MLREEHQPGLIGTTLLDIALCSSFREQFEGRCWLHAGLDVDNRTQPEHIEKLPRFYMNNGMTSVRGRLPTAGRNDGRYFAHTESSALTSIDRHNPRRA